MDKNIETTNKASDTREDVVEVTPDVVEEIDKLSGSNWSKQTMNQLNKKRETE